MIPKTLHYCWFGKGPKPVSFSDCLDSWKKYCPDYKIVEWNEDNAPNKEQHFYKNAIRKKQYAFVADCVRARVLLTEGGIYLDTDMLLLKSVDTLLKYDFFIGEEVPGRIAFGLFGAVPGHPFLTRMDAFYNNTEFYSFSPPVITHTFSPLININTLNFNDKILPPDYFYPLAYEDKEEKYLKYTTLNTYAVHLWEHSWKKSNYETTSQLLKNLITVGNDYLFHGYSIPYVKRYGKEFSRKLYHKLFGKNKTAKPQPSTINHQLSTNNCQPKILHLTTSSKGGAGIAALRLHRALREAGIASAFLSKDFTMDFEGNIIIDTFFNYKKPSLAQRAYRKLRLVLFPSSIQKITKYLSKLDSKLDYEILTLPFSSFHLSNHPLVQQADLINLHWVGGILDYSTFFENIEKPIVWTLHDMNPFLGLFHYGEDEETNERIVKDLDSEIKKIKAIALRNIHRGAIISPSSWMLQKAKESGVFENFLIQETIPNSVDLKIFTIQDKELLRKKKGIPDTDFVLLFISHSTESRRKGLDLLLEALLFLDGFPITLITVGKGEVISPAKNIKMIPLGEVSSEIEMAQYYALADAFVLPSREDNLPNVMLEAFACGTPVIAFKNGGMQEHIMEGINGQLSPEPTGKSLSQTLNDLYKNKETYNREHIREYAENTFNFKKQAESYIEIYKKLQK